MSVKILICGAAIGLSSVAIAEAPVKSPQSAKPTPVEDASAPTSPTARQAKVTSLGNITTEVEGDLTIVTARLNKTPDWKEVPLEEHGTFLQIKLPQTQIPASGEFVDGNGPFLKKLATFQLPEDDGALRLFLNQDAAKAKLATTAELLGDRLIITIDHKKLEQLIAPQQAKPDSAVAAEIVAKTTVAPNAGPAPGDLITPVSQEKNPKNDNPGTAANLPAQLTKIAAFCAVLFLALIGAHWARTRRGRPRRSSFDGAAFEPATMKILSNINISAKQRLTLVQIGDQQILLGVGQDSINLLTTIEPKPRVSAFARQLDAANPNADIRLKAPEDVVPARSARRPAIASTTPVRGETAVKGNRVNVAVGEHGAKNLGTSTAKNDDDITKILRDRLRNLPPG